MLRRKIELIICKTTKVLKNPSLEKSLLKSNQKWSTEICQKLSGLFNYSFSTLAKFFKKLKLLTL